MVKYWPNYQTDRRLNVQLHVLMLEIIQLYAKNKVVSFSFAWLETRNVLPAPLTLRLKMQYPCLGLWFQAILIKTDYLLVN